MFKIFFLLSVLLVATLAQFVSSTNVCTQPINFPNGSSLNLSGVDLFFPSSQLTQIGVGGGNFDWQMSLCDSSKTPPGGSGCPNNFVAESDCLVTFPTSSAAPSATSGDHITFTFTSTSQSLSWVAHCNCFCGTSENLIVPSGSYDAFQPTTSSVDLVFNVQSSKCCVNPPTTTTTTITTTTTTTTASPETTPAPPPVTTTQSTSVWNHPFEAATIVLSCVCLGLVIAVIILVCYIVRSKQGETQPPGTMSHAIHNTGSLAYGTHDHEPSAFT